MASDEPTKWKQFGRELAALGVVCHEDRSQRPTVTSRSADSDRPPAGEYDDTDADSSDDGEKNSNDLLPTEPAFLQGCAPGVVGSPDTATRENP